MPEGASCVTADRAARSNGAYQLLQDGVSSAVSQGLMFQESCFLGAPLHGLIEAAQGDGGNLRRISKKGETTIDRDGMARLARALALICGTHHPTTVGLKAAGGSGAERDIKNARALFLRLKRSVPAGSVAMLNA